MGSKATAKTRRSAATGPFAGRFEILRQLGKGGGGTVFLARDSRRGGQEVALKILDLRKSKDPALARAMQNEFAALTQLRHRNLAQVYDFGVTKEEMYFSSEYIEGEDLLAAAREADLNTVFRLVLELLRALDYLHRRGVLHLDLKPENILVAKPEGGERVVKLIDFGLAEWKRQGVSAPGEFSGTPPYSPPELLMEQGASAASDIYSLGMLFHRLFAKEFPFPSQDPMAILQAQVSGPPRHTESLNPALPDGFGELLFRTVAKEAKDRPASVTELLTGINTCLEENFSLRGVTAPAKILEESDHLFRQSLLETVFAELKSESRSRIVVVGGPGLGKSRLLRRCKELLQLTGKHPQYFSQTSALIQDLPGLAGQNQPLLAELDPESGPLNADLSGYAGPILLACSDPASVPAGYRIETLAPLNEAQLEEFLRSEVQEFPLETGLKSLLAQSEGNPNLLENILQALREEGLLLWSDRGWRWSAADAALPDRILDAQAGRWVERRVQALEILRLAPLGLSAEVLAGLLGVEPVSFRHWLESWRQEGSIALRGEGDQAVYAVPTAENRDSEQALQNWEELQGDLERFYAQGRFGLGVRIAALLEQGHTARDSIPPVIRILAARHYVASGKNEAALALLPEKLPTEDKPAGLLFEIRARAESSLGDLDAAGRSLDLAQQHYETAGDACGLSRVYNLRGWTDKRRGLAKQAIGYFEQAIDQAVRASDRYAQGLAEMNLGTVHHDQGELDLARNFYEQALASAEAAGHPLLQLKLLQNRVNLLFTMGRASEAEAGAYDLLRLALRKNFPEEQAAALNFLSLFSGQRGDLSAQKQYLDQAIAILAPRPNSPLLPQLYFNRGYLHWDAKKFPAAQLDAEAALELARRMANPFLTAWSQLLLGKVLRDRAKPDLAAARLQLEGSRRDMEENNLGHLLWEADFDLGLLDKREGKADAAKSSFLAAKQHLEKMLPQLPEGQRQSYLRDRKLEKILEAMEDL